MSAGCAAPGCVGCSGFISEMAAPDQAEGAVARKNLSRSRLANRSCSWRVKGRESPAPSWLFWKLWIEDEVRSEIFDKRTRSWSSSSSGPGVIEVIDMSDDWMDSDGREWGRYCELLTKVSEEKRADDVISDGG